MADNQVVNKSRSHVSVVSDEWKTACIKIRGMHVLLLIQSIRKGYDIRRRNVSDRAKIPRCLSQELPANDYLPSKEFLDTVTFSCVVWW